MRETCATFKDPTAWEDYLQFLESIPLPRNVQVIADVIGRDGALRLVAQLPRAYSQGRTSGQVMLYVPHVIPAGHRLAVILGDRAAARLSHVFAGEVMLLPVCFEALKALRNRAIEIELSRGAKSSEIRHLFGMSGSRTRAIIRKLRCRSGSSDAERN